MEIQQAEEKDHYLEDLSLEDQEKLKVLRAIAKEGFDALDRGDYTLLRSPEEVAEFVRALRTKSAIPAT